MAQPQQKIVAPDRVAPAAELGNTFLRRPGDDAVLPHILELEGVFRFDALKGRRPVAPIVFVRGHDFRSVDTRDLVQPIANPGVAHHDDFRHPARCRRGVSIAVGQRDVLRKQHAGAEHDRVAQPARPVDRRRHPCADPQGRSRSLNRPR